MLYEVITEEAGSESHIDLTEHMLEEVGEDMLEVGKADLPFVIHDETLHLVEHRRVGEVVVASEYRPRGDDADRRFALHHRPDLHRRSVGAEQGTVIEVESVLHISRRVVFGEVERFEVVEIILDLV